MRFRTVSFILSYNIIGFNSLSFRTRKPRTKILFYIVKHGPNNTRVVKLMNQMGRKRKETTNGVGNRKIDGFYIHLLILD